jgi:hypothetical protein
MPPDMTIPAMPALPCTSGPCLGCPRSGSPLGLLVAQGRLACRPTRCYGPAAAEWQGGGLLGPDPAGRQAGGRPCRLADRRPGRGPGGAGRDPSCSDPRAPAPRPHPGSNSAGTHALNAVTHVPACCSRSDYGWCFLEVAGNAPVSQASVLARHKVTASGDRRCGREWAVPRRCPVLPTSRLDRAAAMTWPDAAGREYSESVEQLLSCLGDQLHAGDSTEPHERPLLLS